MDEEQDIIDMVSPTWWLYGHIFKSEMAPDSVCYLSFDAMMNEYHAMANDSEYVDVMELMGGEARTTQCLVRRRFGGRSLHLGLSFPRS